MTELLARPSSVSEREPVLLDTGCLRLARRDIHIWRCSRTAIASSDEFKRRVLSLYAGIEPGDLQFVVGRHGKPRLVGAAHVLDFNLSHSGDWLACAVTAGFPVGVDVEACEPSRTVMPLARRCFRAEEVAALAACGDVEQRERFYDFWTLKEAAVKARGSVLVSGLDSRGFALAYSSDDPAARGHIGVTAIGDVDKAHYCLLDLLPGYRLAICWLPPVALQPRLRAFGLSGSGESVVLDLSLRASTWMDFS